MAQVLLVWLLEEAKILRSPCPGNDEYQGKLTSDEINEREGEGGRSVRRMRSPILPCVSGKEVSQRAKSGCADDRLESRLSRTGSNGRIQ